MTDDRRPSPFPIRLTDEERAEAEARAARAGLSLGGFFKAAALDSAPPRKHPVRQPSPDRAMLGQLVAQTGKIGSNVNQLARQANCGSWPDQFAIEEAAADIRWMRDALMTALGITPPADNDNVVAYPPDGLPEP